MQLTGPPKINGFLAPMPSKDAHMGVFWDHSETRRRRYRSGRTEIIEQRLRGRIAWTWNALSYDEAEWILAELRSGIVTITPRTRTATDPAWIEELSFECEVMSDLPSTAALASLLFPLSVELRTTTTYSEQPGLVAAGTLTLTAEDADQATFAATGGISFLETTETITYRGTDYDVTTVTIQPPPVARQRVVDEGTTARLIVDTE